MNLPATKIDNRLSSEYAFDATLESTIRIARSAGEKILEYYESELSVIAKADNTPLTEADLAANQIIIDQLQQITPDIPILTEESCGIPFEERHEWETYWLVDPLDGTREFIKRNGEFSVNIALIRGGCPILGVVHAPVLDVTYWGYDGGGAWKQEADGLPQPIKVRIAPATEVTIARSRAPLNGGRLNRFLDKLGKYHTVSMGSALKSCLVAEGRADLYARLGPTCEWDTGAAQCIVEQAGGHVTDTRMQDLRYNTRESLLNPHFFVFGAGNHDWSEYLDSEAG